MSEDLLQTPQAELAHSGEQNLKDQKMWVAASSELLTNGQASGRETAYFSPDDDSVQYGSEGLPDLQNSLLRRRLGMQAGIPPKFDVSQHGLIHLTDEDVANKKAEEWARSFTGEAAITMTLDPVNNFTTLSVGSYNEASSWGREDFAVFALEGQHSYVDALARAQTTFPQVFKDFADKNKNFRLPEAIDESKIVDLSEIHALSDEVKQAAAKEEAEYASKLEAARAEAEAAAARSAASEALDNHPEGTEGEAPQEAPAGQPIVETEPEASTPIDPSSQESTGLASTPNALPPTQEASATSSPERTKPAERRRDRLAKALGALARGNVTGAVAHLRRKTEAMEPAHETDSANVQPVESPESTYYEEEPNSDLGLDLLDALQPAEEDGMAKVDTGSRFKRLKDVANGWVLMGVAGAVSGIANAASGAAKIASSVGGAASVALESTSGLAPNLGLLESQPQSGKKEMTRRAKTILAAGAGVIAAGAAIYLGIIPKSSEHTQMATDMANQLGGGTGVSTGGIDTSTVNHAPSAGSIFSEANQAPTTSIRANELTNQLPVSETQLPSGSTNFQEQPLQVPGRSGVDTSTIPSFEGTGKLQPGDTIWEDSRQTILNSGFKGSPDQLESRTTALTNWRLREMGISAQEATQLEPGRELPMPTAAELAALG